MQLGELQLGEMPHTQYIYIYIYIYIKGKLRKLDNSTEIINNKIYYHEYLFNSFG